MGQASRRVVDISGATFFRLVLTAVLVWLWLRIWQWILLFVVAIFLAIALDPVVRWLEARGLRRSFASLLVTAAVTGALVLFLYFSGASLVDQGKFLTTHLDDLQQKLVSTVPEGLLQLLPRIDSPNALIGTYLGSLGRALMNGLLGIGVALVLTLYLLIDGERTCRWLVAFAGRHHRRRIEQTVDEAHRAVLAYMRGNFLTSLLAFLFTWIFLALLGVPAAFLLGLLTGVFDLIPVIGFFLSAAPAVLLALTVSSWVGVAVAAFFVGYNAVENYYISPKVYGRELRLSDLAVIASFALGAEIGGVLGALIALPLVAMYPAIENLWLADRIGPEVVQEHREIERSAES